nr:hypothetical protein [Tanacetum cinerariifolium]
MFTPQPGRAYVNGTFTYVIKPDGDLDTGMHALGNDHDVRKLAEYVRLGNKMTGVYIEHERTTLHTYYMTHEDADFSIPKCVIEEIKDDAMPEMRVTKLKPRKLVIGHSAKKLMLEWNDEANVGSMDNGQASKGTKEIDLVGLDVTDREIPPFVRNGKVVLEITEEEEITRAKDGGEGNETEANDVNDRKEGSGSESSDDGNDSDELVDVENLVEHVHVNTDTFDKNNPDTMGHDASLMLSKK